MFIASAVNVLWDNVSTCIVIQLPACRCVGKVHRRNTLEQMKLVGPNTLSVALLTSAFVGMVFTIQVRACALLYTVHAFSLPVKVF